MSVNVYPSGWIPYPDRTREQQKQTDEFHEGLPKYSQACTIIAPPEKTILHLLEIRHFGALMPRIRQLTGSCVGAGGWRSYCHSQLGDVILRGDREEVKMPFPWATYGVGRQNAGMRGRGEGSYGAAQAKAVAEFGMLPWDYPGLPAPKISGGWASWSSAIELQWSHPSGWPTPRSTLEPEAQNYQMGTVTRIHNSAEAQNLLAQGYGLTLASNFGTRPKVEKGVLLGRWNGSWAHQMSGGAYWDHPDLGLIFGIDNQWGPDAHPTCPEFSKIGVNGSFWVLSETFDEICEKGEVYGHSNTEGFPLRIFNWDNLLSM